MKTYHCSNSYKIMPSGSFNLYSKYKGMKDSIIGCTGRHHPMGLIASIRIDNWYYIDSLLGWINFSECSKGSLIFVNKKETII